MVSFLDEFALTLHYKKRKNLYKIHTPGRLPHRRRQHHHISNNKTSATTTTKREDKNITRLCCVLLARVTKKVSTRLRCDCDTASNFPQGLSQLRPSACTPFLTRHITQKHTLTHTTLQTRGNFIFHITFRLRELADFVILGFHYIFPHPSLHSFLHFHPNNFYVHRIFFMYQNE